MAANKRKLIIAAGLIGAAILFFFLLSSSDRRQENSGTLRLESAPTTLKLTLDGSEIANSGSRFVSVGDHTLVASQDGFETKTIKFSIAQNEEKEIQIFIQPANDKGLAFLEENPDEAILIEGLSSQAADAASEQATAENPIISDLPVSDRTFRIDYGTSRKTPEKPGAVAIYIRAIDQQGRADALDWMRTFGYNPDDYEIIYINPLDEIE